MLDSNQRPPACEAGALPTELIDRVLGFYVPALTASTERDDDVPENVPAGLRATPLRSDHRGREVVVVEGGARLVSGRHRGDSAMPGAIAPAVPALYLRRRYIAARFPT
jgi:hypothetical protein